jgi:sialic acid synthase SpsE/sugar phosphate isomerase/epimerase
MLITKSIKKFIVFKEDSILDALQKIEENKNGFTFVLDYSGVLEGVITDGDFRRWLTKNKTFDLGVGVSNVMKKDFFSHQISDSSEDISRSFSSKVKIIPLIDNFGRLKAIALSQDQGLQIGERHITENSPCFVIAEIGNNHNGDINLAKQLVDLAIESGADCVKFQMRNVQKLYKNNGKATDKSADLGAQYTLDLLSRFQLKNEELLEVFDYCKSKGKIPLCTPWDLDSVEILERYGMEAYKVSSADLTNTELLDALISTGKPLLCSTGMSTEVEIKRTVKYFNDKHTLYVMLHCNSTYPTPYRDVNLLYLSRLSEISGGPVGYSGHERGYIIPVVAVGMGARVIEKHFTLDKNMEGNDHKVSLLPDEFKEMVKQIRLVEEGMGSNSERTISQGESMNREILAKSLVINQDLKIGQKILREMINVKSPGQGVQPYRIEELLGKKANRDFISGDYFYESDIKNIVIKGRDYKFNRMFGIPVRYHDYIKLTSQTNVDFVEFHLSYRDLEEDISNIFNEVQDIEFAVHCPELFPGDHILDLCSEKNDYRERSISELQKVVDVTRKLKLYFPKTDNPVIIVNVGGFNKTGFLAEEDIIIMYEKVANALDRINSEGVELIIQTMPPFPWHFGGQSYHNLFVSPNEIADFCKKTGYRICLDISHSQMACFFYKWNLDDFVKIVSRHVAYLHIVDALGVDGEGIHIGKGDVDFVQLTETLENLLPNVPFIPEIWQGHKENGAGFWKGLEFLEKYL